MGAKSIVFTVSEIMLGVCTQGMMTLGPLRILLTGGPISGICPASSSRSTLCLLFPL